MKFEITGRKIDAPELLGMLEDSDSETEWHVKKVPAQPKEHKTIWHLLDIQGNWIKATAPLTELIPYSTGEYNNIFINRDRTLIYKSAE